MVPESFVPSLAGRQIGGAGTDFVVVEWTDSGDSEPGWLVAPHVHHCDDEAWYVLEGTLRFLIDDEMFEAGPGSAVLAPKGVRHAWGNATPGQPARYLLVMTPNIRALIDALHRADASEQPAIFRAHDSELVS